MRRGSLASPRFPQTIIQCSLSNLLRYERFTHIPGLGTKFMYSISHMTGQSKISLSSLSTSHKVDIPLNHTSVSKRLPWNTLSCSAANCFAGRFHACLNCVIFPPNFHSCRLQFLSRPNHWITVYHLTLLTFLNNSLHFVVVVFFCFVLVYLHWYHFSNSLTFPMFLLESNKEKNSPILNCFIDGNAGVVVSPVAAVNCFCSDLLSLRCLYHLTCKCYFFYRP